MMHTRSAGGDGILGVDFPERTIVVVDLPYNEFAPIHYRGQVWRETIQPGAFDGVDWRRLRVCREHVKADTVGKVTALNPHDPRGLIATIRVAKTARGDDTLQLAAEGCLSASIGFGVNDNGEKLDRFVRVRTITSGWLDHISLVMDPAYASAAIVGVRAGTPHLDAYRNDRVLAWAAWHCHPTTTWARGRLNARR